MKNLIAIILFVCFAAFTSVAQTTSSNNIQVANVPIKKILNYNSGAKVFKELQNKITLVDFFATWCVPCIKALPHLSKIQQEFKDVGIVLVSDETEAQLTKFIKARSGFSFPVIVDEDEKWNTVFQPPSLPYTVVINEAGNMIAITEAASINSDSIKKWLLMDSASSTIIFQNKSQTAMATKSFQQISRNATVQLSQDFIYKAKTSEPVDDAAKKLNDISYQSLVNSLVTDNDKKAFWINLYNGYTQAALKTNPDAYKDRSSFFKSKRLKIAGIDLSLDDVEHNILRRSKIKWSLGYLSKLFPSKQEKDLRVNNLDYRIHFALNCGAKSCPPIAFYNPENLETQLDLATKVYLTGEAKYDTQTNTLTLPKLMSWFRRDFGGKKGMIKIAKQFNIIPANAKPKIKFSDYDWTLSLDNYTK